MYFRENICSFLSKSYYFYILGVSHLKAVSHNGTCSRPSDVAWKSFRENNFKIDYLFYTTNIGGPLMPPKLINKLLLKKG